MTVRLNPTVDPRDVRRLEGQCGVILDLLRERPRTNRELAQVSLKYTSRLDDIRNAGYRVDAERGKGGLWTYTLVEKRKPEQLRLV